MTAPKDSGPSEQVSWPIVHEVDTLWCSTRAREFAVHVGFDQHAIWEVEIVVRELVTNVIKYAKRGQLVLEYVAAPEPFLRIIVEDDGKGIDDVASAFIDGYSEGRMLADVRYAERSGLGSGLGAVRRLTDRVTIKKKEHGGTRVTAEKNIRRSGWRAG
jgi:anti-sigma regulatory factor (Ser/Thr protein kinase)